MPRQSARQKALRAYERKIQQQREEALLHQLIWSDEELERDGDDISTGSELLRTMITSQLEQEYTRCTQERYLQSRKPYRSNGDYSIFARDLVDEDDEHGSPPWLTDEEFLQKYRLHRDSMHYVVSRIQGHHIFSSNKSRRPQRPPCHQLMVFLHYLGTSGSGASNPRVRNVFGIGRGTAELYKGRCVAALRSIKDEVIKWPDDREKKEIARRIFVSTNRDWINCIGIADGTLLPLTYAPQSSDAPDYHGRKHQYSLSVMIINDDMKRIRMYNAGNPGCVHDSRIYSQMPLFTQPDQYFNNQRYFILGDSAFVNSPTMVTSYKAPRGHALSKDQEAFNTSLGRIRVTSEHTIGMLKARFPILRSLPMRITNNKNSVRRIIRIIECCIILHNILIDLKDNIPDDWYEDEDNDSDIANEVGEYTFSSPFLDTHPNDERRQRCLQYLKGMGSLN